MSTQYSRLLRVISKPSPDLACGKAFGSAITPIVSVRTRRAMFSLDGRKMGETTGSALPELSLYGTGYSMPIEPGCDAARSHRRTYVAGPCAVSGRACL